jgi:hypothetical protein
MARQLTPDIGTVPTGGRVSVDVEGRRIAVANVDGTWSDNGAKRSSTMSPHYSGTIGNI